MTIKEALRDWTDVDGAQYELAKCLGIIDADASFLDTKHLWWSDTPEGRAMYDLLLFLKDKGFVEYRDEPDFQCRWINDDLED